MIGGVRGHRQGGMWGYLVVQGLSKARICKLRSRYALARSLILVWVVLASGCSDAVAPGDFVRFADVSEQLGLSYVGRSFGAAWGDFNGDGWPDLWASGHSEEFLYVNEAGRGFRNIAREVMPTGRNDRHGAAWADFDHDGDEDLLQSTGGRLGKGDRASKLWVNEGGSFVDGAESLGVADARGRGRTPVWLDVDSDGRLDLLVNNAQRIDARTTIFRQRLQGGFENVGASIGLAPGFGSEYTVLLGESGSRAMTLVFGNPLARRVYCLEGGSLSACTQDYKALRNAARDATSGDFDNDGRLDTMSVQGTRGSDYRQPVDNTVEFLLMKAKNPVGLDIETAGALTLDIGPVAPLWWQPAHVHVGSRGWSAEELPLVLSRGDPRAHGLVDVSARDRGVYVGYDPEAGTWAIRFYSPDHRQLVGSMRSSEPIKRVARIGFEGPQPGFAPRVVLNKQGGYVRGKVELEDGEGLNGFSIGVGDFDNDMDLDAYIVCSGSVTNRPNRFLENLGGGRFRRITLDTGGEGSDQGVGDTVAVVDYDQDGFLDLFLTNGFGQGQGNFSMGPHQLLRNLGNGNHWIEIDLVGRSSNRNGIGAMVAVTAGGMTQYRFQDNGTHNKAQDHRRLHFGLAQHTEIDSIRVEWPSGQTQVLTGIPVDRSMVIVEPH